MVESVVQRAGRWEALHRIGPCAATSGRFRAGLRTDDRQKRCALSWRYGVSANNGLNAVRPEKSRQFRPTL